MVFNNFSKNIPKTQNMYSNNINYILKLSLVINIAPTYIMNVTKADYWKIILRQKSPVHNLFHPHHCIATVIKYKTC